MEVIKTNIDGVVIIEPKVFGDHRGYFFESFSEKDFTSQVREVKLYKTMKANPATEFLEVSTSRNRLMHKVNL